MEGFRLQWIAEAVASRLAPEHAGLVPQGLCTDTRELRPGCLFVALRGERFDGARFLPEAFARGALAVIASGDAPDCGPRRPVLRVPDTRLALAQLARAYRAALGFRVAAITGSAGKTTTKELLHRMLREQLPCVAAPKSFNNEVGVPLTLLAARPDTQVVVAEMGTNHPGEIDLVASIAQPDLQIITCIGAAHLEGLGGIEGVAREKLSALRHLRAGGCAVLNGDDLRLRGAASALAQVRGPEAVRLCGLGPDLPWRGRVIREGLPWRMRTVLNGRPGPELELPVPGLSFAQDALLALAAAERLGADPERAAAAVRAMAAPRGRWAVTEVAGVTLIDDSYNANPTSVAASLETLAALAAPAARVVVLGGMLELGVQSASLHREVGRRVARMGVRRLACVGPEAGAIADGARRAGLDPGRVLELERAEDVAPALDGELSPGTRLLCKGSRGFRLERAIDALRARLEGGEAQRCAA